MDHDISEKEYLEAVSSQVKLFIDCYGTAVANFVWPNPKLKPAFSSPDFTYDVDCGYPDLAFVIRRNIEGYNVAIELDKNATFRNGHCDGEPSKIELLAVQIFVDGHNMDLDSATRRIMDIDLEEFGKAAYILRDGTDFWIVVRIPQLESSCEQMRFINDFMSYLVYLAFKWNHRTGCILDFEINTRLFWPNMTIPLAGTLNHHYDPPCRIEWVKAGRPEAQNKVLIDIRKAGNAFKKTEILDGIYGNRLARRYIPILCIDNKFGATAFQRYCLEWNNRPNRPKPVRGIIPYPYYQALTIFLRSNFLAAPAIISEILSMHPWTTKYDYCLTLEEIQRYLDLIILKSDLFIANLISTFKITNLDPDRCAFFSRALTILPKSEACSSLDDIRKVQGATDDLTITIARNGLYLLRFASEQRKTFWYRHPTSKEKYEYVAFPSIFMLRPANPIDERGVLLVRSEIAEELINGINKLPVGIPLFLYFWRYAHHFLLIPTPYPNEGYGPISKDILLSWFDKTYPDISRFIKLHERDRTRKQNADGISFIEPMIQPK